MGPSNGRRVDETKKNARATVRFAALAHLTSNRSRMILGLVTGPLGIGLEGRCLVRQENEEVDLVHSEHALARA